MRAGAAGKKRLRIAKFCIATRFGNQHFLPCIGKIETNNVANNA